MRATIRTPVPDPETVAAAIRPDNTDEMTTRVEADAVVTAIERETASGLLTTVDDYVVNLTVATELTERTTDLQHRS
jgi:hypothetical protein